MTSRFNRSIRFFGREGQDRLRDTRVAVAGVGGIGTHVVQQVALLGVGEVHLIEPEEADDTNRNRYIGLRADDPVPGTLKVDIAERLIREIDPLIRVVKVKASVVSRLAFASLLECTHVFGCLDQDHPRLVLNEFCAAYSLPYIDSGTEILPGEPVIYGGRVCVAWDGRGCLSCLGELDQQELGEQDAEEARAAIYGLERDLLGGSGPSVVFLNGLVASLAVGEFALAVSGIRPPQRLLKFYGNSGKVVVNADPPDDCYYCRTVRGTGQQAGLERYLPGES